jgi:hypothetical protein
MYGGVGACSAGSLGVSERAATSGDRALFGSTPEFGWTVNWIPPLPVPEALLGNDDPGLAAGGGPLATCRCVDGERVGTAINRSILCRRGQVECAPSARPALSDGESCPAMVIVPVRGAPVRGATAYWTLPLPSAS